MTLIHFFQSVAITGLMSLSTPALAKDAALLPGWSAEGSESVTEQADHVFTLTNDTSVDMLEFYASPQAATDWESNILESKIIRANGDWTLITLPGNRGCVYDFLAVFADGDTLDRYGINVCELETHTYYEN